MTGNQWCAAPRCAVLCCAAVPCCTALCWDAGTRPGRAPAPRFGWRSLLLRPPLSRFVASVPKAVGSRSSSCPFRHPAQCRVSAAWPPLPSVLPPCTVRAVRGAAGLLEHHGLVAGPQRAPAGQAAAAQGRLGAAAAGGRGPGRTGPGVGRGALGRRQLPESYCCLHRSTPPPGTWAGLGRQAPFYPAPLALARKRPKGDKSD